MDDPTDAEREELEDRVSDILYEVAKFAWADLAERVPTGRTYIRPEAEGRYMAVTWDADWKSCEGGPILSRSKAFLTRLIKRQSNGRARLSGSAVSLAA